MLLYFEVSENFGEETLDALQAQVKSNKPKVSIDSVDVSFEPKMDQNDHVADPLNV